MAEGLEVRHCFGDHYTSFSRFGDGVDVRMEVEGNGC
jgi:hypothetical protein